MLFLLAAAASAQQPAPRVETVITVERKAEPVGETAAAVTVLRRDELAKQPSETLAEALAQVPGITMMFDGAASGTPMITSRGFFGGGEVEYVKLLVDGAPVGDRESGLADWSRFRLGGIDRIEIVHGPGSAAWGDAALGGVIQLFTRRDAADKPGDLHLTAGSFGSRGAELGYLADLNHHLRLGVRADVAETDGFRDNASRDDRDLSLTLDRLLDISRWQFTLATARKDRREPGPLTRAQLDADRTQSDPLFRNDREETTRDRFSAAYDSFGESSLHVLAHAARRTSSNLRTLLLAPAFGITALRDLSTNDEGISADVTRGHFHAGVDVARASIDGNYFSADKRIASENGTRRDAGVYVTGSWNVCSRCRFTAGLRRDSIRDDFGAHGSADATSPRAAFTVAAGDTSFFVQLSRAFKAATLDQLFDPRPFPNFRGGTFTISNPDLKPQRARNLEAGASGTHRGAKWTLVAYRMNVTDEIDFDPSTFTYRNIGRSIHRGVEASVSLGAFARVTPAFTYAWTRVADEANRDQQLKNIPEHVAQALISSELPHAVSFDVVYRYMRGRFLDDDGRFSEPDVSRVDLRLSRAFGAARVGADVINATNAHYNELGYVLADFKGQPTPLEFPAPGRNLRLGITWTF